MHQTASNFHFSRLFKGDTQALALARHEHYLFSYLDLRPKMTVLEVNCGVGTAVLELADFADVSVVGVDPDPGKIKQAKRTAKERGLSERVLFMRSDYSNLRTLFQDSSFDGVYCIESLKCSSTFTSIYQDLCHLLRPGGKLAVYEWCWTNDMNPNNVEHQRLAELLQISTGIGIRSISERSLDTAVNALQTCHLQVEHQEDLSKSSSCGMVPWYTWLDNALSDSNVRWPSNFIEEGRFGSLTKNGAEIVSMAGHLKLFTPMALFVARRPKSCP